MSLLVSRYYSEVHLYSNEQCSHMHVLLCNPIVSDSGAGNPSWDGSSVSLNTFSAAFLKCFLLHECFTCIFIHQHSFSILFTSN